MSIMDTILKRALSLSLIICISVSILKLILNHTDSIPKGLLLSNSTNDRFMNEHVKDVLQGHLGWGAGRRVCVGWNVGLKNMFIVFSRLLYCFDFIEDPVISFSGPY